MRVIVGAIAILSVAVTVAVAQPPIQRERAAALKPPVALRPDQSTVARGAIDDPPSSTPLPSSPVVRTTVPTTRWKTPAEPAWLNGVDANLAPAAGVAPPTAAVRSLARPAAPEGDDRSLPPKMLNRFRGVIVGDKGVIQPTAPPQPAQAETPGASAPFRGTSANGSPVYAGPPAYRWYGWGSVTPGANPLAPAGQYPKASAAWYSITGATPGAFPVPVSNTNRIVPGTDPPNYGLARTMSAPQPVVPVATHPQSQPAAQPQPQPHYQPQPQVLPVPTKIETPPSSLPSGSKFMPAPSMAGAVPPTPTPPPQSLAATGAPSPTPPPPIAPPAPSPVGVPTITLPPVPKSVAAAPVTPAPVPEPAKEPLALPPLPKLEPIAAAPLPPPVPTIPSTESPRPTVPTTESKPAIPTSDAKRTDAGPQPLPLSVTTDPPRPDAPWQPSTQPNAPPPGAWSPAEGMSPLPTVPAEQPPSPRTGSALVKPVVARGQMSDPTPDPVAKLIKQVCQGRAEGVEVRWAGTKKLSVCFEVRTAADAQKLVNDISRRRELNPYQIDFCVLVK